jgi:hypothetical protein
MYLLWWWKTQTASRMHLKQVEIHLLEEGVNWLYEKLFLEVEVMHHGRRGRSHQKLYTCTSSGAGWKRRFLKALATQRLYWPPPIKYVCRWRTKKSQMFGKSTCHAVPMHPCMRNFYSQKGPHEFMKGGGKTRTGPFGDLAVVTSKGRSRPATKNWWGTHANSATAGIMFFNLFS